MESPADVSCDEHDHRGREGSANPPTAHPLFVRPTEHGMNTNMLMARAPDDGVSVLVPASMMRMTNMVF